MLDDLGPHLLDWFRASRRLFPWRGPFPRDPYRVLLSEVMAQQTQIDRVVPLYVRFLERFPDVAALAAAVPDDVIHLWTGLGYYRRARLLHAAARIVALAGGWPHTREGLARLPGVGPYSSAALAAFSFDGDDPPVDGNVERVAARFLALELPLGTRQLRRAAESLVRGMWAGVRSPEVFEAVMELGATICSPRAPRCPLCPLASECSARRGGREQELPRPKQIPPRRTIRWVSVWLERDDGRVLLQRIDDGGLLGGLWLPPSAVLEPPRQAPATLARRVARAAGHSGGLAAAAEVAHAMTHRQLLVMPFFSRWETRAVAENRPDWSWQDPAALTVGTSSLLGKLRRACGVVAGR